MLKKILLFMSLLFLFLATTFAAGTHKAGDVYDPNNQVVQDTIGKQDSIGTITADEYKKVAEHFTDLDGKPMKKDRVDALVSDGKIGDVTRFLLEQREGKSDVESLAAADKQNQD
ncbi:hypothetical protein LR004_00810, partial [Candidatus Gracilibacteria bacterium]|nr:hypothetical protein [Candidatus Gracilibacteria bacterium]